MAGTFSKDARPVGAGSFMDFIVQTPTVVLPSTGKIVCVGFTHNWGPLKTPTLLTSFGQFLNLFKGDPSNPTSGFNAVLQAFEGDQDFGGAAAVLAYRMGTVTGSPAAKATRTLQNTTPALALTMTAKYEGTLANGLTVTTQDFAGDATRNQLLLFRGTQLLETYTYLDADIAGLATQINASSNWMTAVANVTGVALANVSGQAFSAGADGGTLVTGDYTTAMSDLGTQRFGVLTFENLTDAPITASLKSWVQTQQTAGYRFFFVTGGVGSESSSTAITRAGTLNDPNIVTIGQGNLTDNNLLTSAGVPTALTPAQFAPRLAGSLAARGERYSLTYAKFPGIVLAQGATASEIAAAQAGGLIVLDRMSDSTATVRIANGVTTYTTTTDPTTPKPIFMMPKFVATMQGLQNDLTLWSDANIIGKQTVDNDTRTAVLAQINELMRQRELLGSVQPGWSAFVDPTPPPSDSDAFVAFVILAKFGRSVEQVYFTGQLS